MKTYELFIEATEEQARASNPNASPELIRRAAERSQRSAARRNANQTTSQNNIKKGIRALPAADMGSAIVRVKQGAPSREAVGRRAPAQKGYMTSPDGIRKPKNNVHGPTTSKNSQKPAGPGNSEYDKARKKRDLENRLDKEDSKKGKFGNFVKKKLGQTKNFIRDNQPKAGSVATSKAGPISGPQISDNN